jgi:hypothetical protein
MLISHTAFHDDGSGLSTVFHGSSGYAHDTTNSNNGPDVRGALIPFGPNIGGGGLC